MAGERAKARATERGATKIWPGDETDTMRFVPSHPSGGEGQGEGEIGEDSGKEVIGYERQPLFNDFNLFSTIKERKNHD